MRYMPSPADSHFAALDQSIPNRADHELALRYAPRIRFDMQEPFYPSAVGYTVFRESGPSPSFPRVIFLNDPAVIAIECAIWWDWDIQHLYELEHVWIYLDAAGNLVDAEASWHGSYHSMVEWRGSVPHIPNEDGRLVVYSEAGKHAFAPSPDRLRKRSLLTRLCCGRRAGKMGVHVTPLFNGIIKRRTLRNNRLVHAYLEQSAFEPTFDFVNTCALETIPHVPWQALFRWIPERVAWWCAYLGDAAPFTEGRPQFAPHNASALRPEFGLIWAGR
jgi:putative hydrolase of the HAD superfamily